MNAADPELKRELDATLQTRKELGPEYEDELIDSFLGKMDQRLDALVETRVRRRIAEEQLSTSREAPSGRRPEAPPTSAAVLGLAVVSLVLSVPLTAIVSQETNVFGVLLVWLGIVGVNAVHSAGRLGWGHRRD
ncbi:hypothetical protein V1J52_14445 [Streptomyces sp. TRM 70351]|uniref:hypothetical protein n=1 Tax=Streptomyces sp. TRM 70351 TaxID=3116552 RepID=UPI002E7B4B6E|nr:hypothetical protein [Streptomyces sp. TRM 70351]MEE1929366.1 hypothetical protein [Streptomyces sp. TRM 70351]